MDTAVVRKPNIYLYPQRKCSVNVELDLPLGGSIVKSIPEYQNGWKVEVDPGGKINGEFDYLFYESSNPDKFQYSHGWIIGSNRLQIFFQKNLSDAGFNRKEINDFIEYWIPKLTDYRYYIIYPQHIRIIEQMIKLKVTSKPESILRYYYVIKGSNNKDVQINIPEISKFIRKGFTVTEWGVVLK